MYVGLDVHKKVCYGTVMDENGRVVKQAKFTNDHETLDGFMKGLHEARVVMEAAALLAAPLRPAGGGGPRRPPRPPQGGEGPP